VKLNAARGFRSPQLNELYLFPISDPDLEPEKVWSYEIGLRADVGGRTQLNLAAFKMEGDGLIEVSSKGRSPQKVMYRNTGEIDFGGLEASIRLRPVAPVEARLAYSYLDPGDRTTGRPGIKIDADLRLEAGRNRVTTDLQFVDAYYAADSRQARIDEYLVVNARAAREVIRGLEASVSVKNIFDEAYEVYTEIPGGSSGLYTMPGRRYQFGLRYGWLKD
jgi:outer membrane receptor protein involved in Fe transport